MIRFLLDTNAAIFAMIDAAGPVNRRIGAHAPGELAISAISFAEIALGVETQRPPPPEVLAAFTAQIPVLPFDEAAARAYARLPFRRGRFDRLIAAHALSIGATVVTANVGDFGDVPGLVVEDWTG